MTRADMDARGTCVKIGVKNKRVNMTIRPHRIPDAPVWAPAAKLMAVRENDPPAG